MCEQLKKTSCLDTTQHYYYQQQLPYKQQQNNHHLNNKKTIIIWTTTTKPSSFQQQQKEQWSDMEHELKIKELKLLLINSQQRILGEEIKLVLLEL